MASRSFKQFLFSLNPYLCHLQGQIAIGTSGAVDSYNGSGIQSVTKLATGVYKIALQDNYYRFLHFESDIQLPPTGSTAVGSITPGVVYEIATLGTTTQAQWETAGVPVGVEAAVGLPFVCAATSSGTGTCSTPASSGITNIDIVGTPNLSVNFAPANSVYPYIIIQCMGPTASGDTAQVATNPVSGSVIDFSIFLRNSSLPGLNE